MFSEAPKAWVEEGTPVEFSRATSLSSLTIDDELPLTVDVVPRVSWQEAGVVRGDFLSEPDFGFI